MSNEIVPRTGSDVILRPNYGGMARPVQRETITFRNTQLIYRNFAGKKGEYNEEGVRGFSILLDEELANHLMERGLNIKPRKNYDDDGAGQMYHLPVAVSYKIRPPRVYMVTGDGATIPFRKSLLPEDSLGMMDNLELAEAHLTVAISNYDVRGTKGKKAYLQSLFGHILLDELEQEYAHVEDMLLDDAEQHKQADILEGEFIIND